MAKGKPVLGSKTNHALKAATIVHSGAIACLQDGLLVEGKVANDLTTIGCAYETIDNSNGADGALTAHVSRGKFGFQTDGTIDQTHVGQTVYVADAYTLTATDAGGTLSAAGNLYALQGDLAIINFGA